MVSDFYSRQERRELFFREKKEYGSNHGSWK
jgi:hypothetical protein